MFIPLARRFAHRSPSRVNISKVDFLLARDYQLTFIFICVFTFTRTRAHFLVAFGPFKCIFTPEKRTTLRVYLRADAFIFELPPPPVSSTIHRFLEHIQHINIAILEIYTNVHFMLLIYLVRRRRQRTFINLHRNLGRNCICTCCV